MSNFVINRTGLDQVTLEMSQTGSSETSVSLREPLLDESLDYVFCVDHLSVPLAGVPITSKINKELFRVVRRNASETLNFDANTVLDAMYTYVLTKQFYDVPSFVRDLNRWARTIEQTIAIAGFEDLRQYGYPYVNPAIPDPNFDLAVFEGEDVKPLRILVARDQDEINELGRYDFLRFKLAIDGTLMFILSHDFTNNFVFKFTRYGAEVLGMGGNVHAVERALITLVDAGDGAGPVPVIGPPQTDYYLAVSTVNALPVLTLAGWLETTVLGANLILPGGNYRESTIHSEHSLYMCLDQRVKILVTSHLPMQNNLLIREGTETVDKAVTEVYFDNEITTTVKFDHAGVFQEQQITNTLYAGMFPFVKKSDTDKQWHRLSTSYGLRFFRFHLYVTYRSYDSVKDEWLMNTRRVTIKEPNYWEFSLRFISEV